MEAMLFLGDNSFVQSAHVQGLHIRIKFGAPGAELVPEIVGLPVVVNEDGGVDVGDVPYALSAVQGPPEQMG